MSTHIAMNIDQQAAAPQRLSPLKWVAILAGALVLGILIKENLLAAGSHDAGHGTEQAAKGLPALWQVGILPFVAILGCIAVLPLIHATEHWWHSNLNKFGVSMGVAGLTLLYYALAKGVGHIPTVLDHAVLAEYVPFIVLLFSLYVISGGISLKGDLAAHPITNTGFLAVGAVIASFIGTTGASMLLIRPLLQTNRERKYVTHTVIFFIFLVSNIGGCLLPIGDPPLFLGYLRGVPFLWTFNLWVEWAVCCAVLLAVYFVWDTIVYKREALRDIQRDETQLEPLRVRGLINLPWLIGIVLCVGLVDPSKAIPGTHWHPFPFMRELLMLGLVALSLKSTPRGVREDNEFNYFAIIEVAALFIGIFIAMQVPVEVLNATGREFRLDRAWEFFWITGTLSSFLDNAPTYVIFFETANAMTHETGPGVLPLLSGHLIREDLLIGVSLGAVFMGAMTYIGNGPNFMVKAIAEQSGVRMPSFFGYMFRFSIPILIPLFIIITLLFLRGGHS